MEISTSKKLLHLFNRAGFGLSPKEWNTVKNWTISKALNYLFEKAEEKNFLDLSIDTTVWDDFDKKNEKVRQEIKTALRKKNFLLNALWVKQMIETENPLIERMTLFWHGHFACITNNVILSKNQNNTIRQHALGNFKDLVLAISKDGGMIRFLNNQQNKKQSPNENFARELLELFTIGRGNYTEQDIKEAARAFTGWSTQLNGAFVFRKPWHDYEEKTFMGRTGHFDGEAIIDIILEQPQTAEFIVTKIYQYFVSETVDPSRVQALAHAFFQSNYNIKSLMRSIFESSWFYDSNHIGTKIKSPTDFIVGVCKTLNIKFEDPKSLLFLQRSLGQELFNPPNVAGWKGGQGWIDNMTLLTRLNLVSYMFNEASLELKVKEEFEAQIENKAIKKIAATYNTTDLHLLLTGEKEETFFNKLLEYLILPPLTMNQESFEKYTNQSTRDAYIDSLTIRLMSIPEYQMC